MGDDARRARGAGAALLAKRPARGRRRRRRHRAEQLATLIYTSGTTGQAQGRRLLHECWAYDGRGDRRDSGILRPDDVQYLWLPMAHSFGKVLEARPDRVGFATAVDGRDHEDRGEPRRWCKPTIMAAVPRIFEKVYNKIVDGRESRRRRSSRRSSSGRSTSAREVSQAAPAGQASRAACSRSSSRIADKLVFSKISERFGGRLRYFISGSAPLSREIAEFFHAAGILILEGYGLTETSAASFVNRPSSYAFGTVGLPMPGTEVKHRARTARS